MLFVFQAQLYGAFDEVTREWSDGVASECVECRAEGFTSLGHGGQWSCGCPLRCAQLWPAGSRVHQIITGPRA